MTWPRITFGIIVLNGEPFIQYNLRSLYPFAHEIVVVEGASINAAHAATPDGHSVDRTLELLHQFKMEEDPDHKVTIVTAENEGYSNGFWPGEKDEQSRAYAVRATGDWLWQVDVDEFYLAVDIHRVMDMLSQDSTISAVTFPELSFWGSKDVRCEGIILQLSYSRFHRLFKWKPGYTMVTHRPPTVADEKGVDLHTLHWVTAQQMEQMGIFLYHYCQIFPKQVSQKMTYYREWIRTTHRGIGWIKDTDRWYHDSFLNLRNPYRVHTVNSWPSWLVRYTGPHPSQVGAMFADIERGEIKATMRDMQDVHKLLASPRYQLGIAFWKLWANFVTLPAQCGRDWVRRRIGLGQFLRELCAIALGRERLF